MSVNRYISTGNFILLLLDVLQTFLVFTAGFLNNLGNYRSFGDTKIVPVIGKEDLHKLIAASEAYKLDSALIDKLWSAASDRLYSLNPGDKQLGFPPQVSCESDCILLREYLAI